MVWKEYHTEVPGIIQQVQDIPEMKRLQKVGMNCGCEYTSFPLFTSMKERYTRFDHSMGAAMLVWRFTEDPAQTLAAAFHDIATPCFAHVVDFMAGDHMTQESTEDKTTEIIAGSNGITGVLNEYGLTVDDVADYHRYPVADNDSPKLSADRLEYTLGNLLNYGKREENECKRYLESLKVGSNEFGEPELMFTEMEQAMDFAHGALEMGRIYVADEDRFAMEMLARLLKTAVADRVIEIDDLWSTEEKVIEKMTMHPVYKERWYHYRGYYQTNRGTGIVIHAKKRYIDPYVEGIGRVSGFCLDFKESLSAFLEDTQDEPVNGLSRYRDEILMYS